MLSLKGIQAESRDFHCIFCSKMRFRLFFLKKDRKSLIWCIFILSKCTHHHHLQTISNKEIREAESQYFVYHLN